MAPPTPRAQVWIDSGLRGLLVSMSGVRSASSALEGHLVISRAGLNDVKILRTLRGNGVLEWSGLHQCISTDRVI